MDDDVRRPNRTFRRLDRSESEPPDQEWRGRANTWFEGGDSSEEGPAPNGPHSNDLQSNTPQPDGGTGQPPQNRGPQHAGAGHSGRSPGGQAEQQTAEQRYASALAALNNMVATLDFEALPWVTEVLRATAGALHEQDASRPSVLNNLGSAAQLSFLASGDIGDLEDAVGYYRSAASTGHDDDPDLALYLCNLALALTDCASRTNDREQSAEATRAARRAADHGGQEHPHRPTALVRLANALKLHARVAEDPDADDESIEVFREALRTTLDGGQEHRSESPELLINLGSALLRRHERGAAPQDLDEGISHLRNGVGLLPDGERRRWALLHFAEALRLRYRQRGDLGDLQTAIHELLGVLDDLAGDNKLLGKLLWNLCSATVEHVESTGEPAILHQTLRAIGPVMRGLATGDPDRAVAVAGYGALVRRHFLYGAAPAALDTAVSAGEAAVQAAEVPAKRYAVLNSLASTLLTRYEHAGNVEDLDRAAEVADDALKTALESTILQYAALTQLGIIAAHRYRTNSDTGELETAMEMFDRALIAMPDDAPERVGVSMHLGRALQTLYRRTGRRKLYRWARRTLTDAANLPTAPADERLRAANLCGRLAAQAHRWSEALEAFTTAVQLLPLVTQGKRAVASPATQRRWAHVAADAAACAVEVGQPERAVELLEHGRRALHSELLPAGGELGTLHQQYPDLATDVVRVRRLLDRPAEEEVLAGPGLTGEARRRRWLAETWDELLAEIRAEQDHEGHLRITPFGRLSATTEDGAVAVVNLSRYRSDALLVFAGRALVVPLPAAAPELAAEQAENAVAAAQNPQPGEWDDQALTDALDWLWHSVARPVLERMGYTRQPEENDRWPRLWWSTVGELSLLPLHAATARSGQSALDRVVSSYTPGLSVLQRAKRREPPPPDSQRALIAAGSAEQAARSHALPRQNQTLARYWPSATVLSAEESDPEDVLELLAQYPLVHLCEPSTQDTEQPAADLVLDREPQGRSLGLIELGQQVLPDAEFAYLGHCATTSGAPSAATLSLAGALGFAGFAHVVGTLWEVDDDSAAQVHADVCADLAQDGGFDTDRSGYALHAAVRRLRAACPEEPARWAAFNHVGP